LPFLPYFIPFPNVFVKKCTFYAYISRSFKSGVFQSQGFFPEPENEKIFTMKDAPDQTDEKKRAFNTEEKIGINIYNIIIL